MSAENGQEIFEKVARLLRQQQEMFGDFEVQSSKEAELQSDRGTEVQSDKDLELQSGGALTD